MQPSAAVKKGEPSDAAPEGPPQPTGPRQPWWTGVMDRRFVKSFEPLATFTKSLVNAGGMKLNHLCFVCVHTCLCFRPCPIELYAWRTKSGLRPALHSAP